MERTRDCILDQNGDVQTDLTPCPVTVPAEIIVSGCPMTIETVPQDGWVTTLPTKYRNCCTELHTQFNYNHLVMMRNALSSALRTQRVMQ